MKLANLISKQLEGRNNIPAPDTDVLSGRLNRTMRMFPAVSILVAAICLSGCTKYALKKDLDELQQDTKETKQELSERLAKVEQAPKADPELLAELADRVNKISLYALELERRLDTTIEAQSKPEPEPQPRMTLGFKAVTMEDMMGLIKKIEELEGNIKQVKAMKKDDLNSVSFPLGKVRVEELSGAEMSKLKENLWRIMEEKPSKVEITGWADGSGAPDKREEYAAERAKSVEAYYRNNVGEGVKIEFLTVLKVAPDAGALWRRADTTIWTTGKD